MISLVIENIRGKNSKIFWLKISAGSGAETVYSPTLKEFGKFSLGNDNAENEMILYPGQFDVSVILSSSVEYHNFINLFRTEGKASIEIRYTNSTGNVRWTGETDYLADNCNPYKRIISFPFYDDLDKFNDTLSVPAPIPPATSYFATAQDMFDAGFMNLGMLINFTSYLQMYYFDGVTDQALNLSELAFRIPDVLTTIDYNESTTDSAVRYSWSNKTNVLISLLNQLGAIGVVEKGYFSGIPHSVLKVYPRYNHDNNIVTLNEHNCYLDSTRTGVAKKFKGLRILAHTGDAGTQKNYYREYHLGDVQRKDDDVNELVYPDDVETIYLLAAGNDHDSGALYVNNLKRLFLDVEYSIIKNRTSILLPTGLSSEKALIDWIANIIWSNIKVARKKLYTTAKGCTYTFAQKFRLETDSNTIYRPIKLLYDEMLDRTEITAIETPAIEEFTLSEV